MIEIGNINKLKVNRKTDIGYMLEGFNDEYFLHNNETNFKQLKPGDEVDAFLYLDNQNRVAATLATPLITTHSFGLVEVADINDSLGVFLDIGINKDLLLSKDDLPLDRSLWPLKGDKLCSTIVYKKRLKAKLLFHELIMLEEPFYTNKDVLSAIVHKVGEAGVNLITDKFESIFVHNSQVRDLPRVGSRVDVRILSQTERGYTATINPFKETLMEDDANIIFNYLLTNDGVMNLNSNSSPEDIKNTFNMSKKAFKRAIGNLYKRRLVEFNEEKTILVKSKNK